MKRPNEPKCPLLSIEKQWEIFAKLIFSDFNPSSVQYHETRKAFFCGYAAGFQVITHVSGQYPEDQAMAYLDSLLNEVTAFEADIKRQVEVKKATKN